MKKKILVVDDETSITRLLKLNLEGTDKYVVREENEGARAVAAAQEFKPDLVLLDVMMPDADGGDVAAGIRGHGELKNVPIVFLTAAVRKGHAAYFWLYPNLMLNWYEGYLDTNLVIPLGIDRVKIVFDFFFADPADVANNEQSIDVSDRIQDEDHAICESVQKGLGSRAYHAGRLSVRREAGENLFHKLLARDLRTGL